MTGPTLPGTTGVDYGIGSLAIQLDGAAGSQLWQKTAAGNAGWMLFDTGSSGVASVFGRTGTIVAVSGDYTVGEVTGAAPIDSPTFTTTAAAPTPSTADNSTKIATTAFVQSNLANYLLSATAATTYAPLASPALTGTPTTPTASPGTNTTQAASTAFVTAAAAALTTGVSSVFTRSGAVTATSGDYTVSQVTGAAPTASPTFTGTPASVTASAGTATTQIATTAFVQTAIAPTYTVLTPGSTITWATAGAPNLNGQVTLGQSSTLAFTGTTGGQAGILKVIQPSAGGPYTLTLPAGSKVANAGAGAVTLSSGASAIDILSFTYDGTNYFWTIVQNFT